MLLPSDVVETAKHSVAFKVHLIIVCVLSCAAFAVWVFVSVFTWQWPWFVYISCAGMFTVSLHYCLGLQRPRQYIQVHVIFYALTNICVFLTWICIQERSSFAWFLYPLFGLGIPLAIHTIFDKYPKTPRLPYTSTLCHSPKHDARTHTHTRERKQ